MTSDVVPFSTNHPTSFPMTRQTQVVGRFPPDMILAQVFVEVFWGCCDTADGAIVRSKTRIHRVKKRKREYHKLSVFSRPPQERRNSPNPPLTADNPPTDNTLQTHPHPLPHSLSFHATGHTSTLLLPKPLLLRLRANSTLNEEHKNP